MGWGCWQVGKWKLLEDSYGYRGDRLQSSEQLPKTIRWRTLNSIIDGDLD